MPLLSAYAFNEGVGTDAAEANGGTSITGVPGWDAGRNGGSSLRTNGEPGPTVTPYAVDSAFTIMWDVYIVGPAPSSYQIMYADYPGVGHVQLFWNGDLEWYHSSGSTGIVANVGDVTWAHIAITADGVNHRLYLDGELVGTAPNAALSGTGTAYLAGTTDFGGYYGNMRMDNLRFFDHAMTKAAIAPYVGVDIGSEILHPWWDGAGGQDSEPIGWWDGSALQNVEVLGAWDGSTVAPIEPLP